MTQEILHNICLLIPCSAPPISSLITWASFEVTSSGNYYKISGIFVTRKWYGLCDLTRQETNFGSTISKKKCHLFARVEVVVLVEYRWGWIFFMVILYQDEVDGSPLWNNIIKYFVVAMFFLLYMYTCLFFFSYSYWPRFLPLIMGAHFLSITPNCNCTSECEYLIRLVFQDHLLLKQTRASTLKLGDGVRVYDKHKQLRQQVRDRRT